MEEEIIKDESFVVASEENEQTPQPAPVEETASPVEPAVEKATTQPEGEPAPEAAVSESSEKPVLPSSCAAVIERLKALEDKASEVAREEFDQLKQVFYRLHNAALAAAREAFVAAGNDADAFIPADQCPDLVAEEETYKGVMDGIREKRAKAQQALNALREENYLRKQAILERLKTMVDNADTENVSYDEFQAIQQEWRDIKDVPPEKANELWKAYQTYTEKFYDIRKLNNMFREYDFKKNLEIKTRLCEQAEALADEPDVVAASRKLQKLHQEYRETGPVAKDIREEVWNRFKEASTIINRRHQEHFDAIKKSESENLEQKIAVCEIVEAIDYDALTSHAAWNEKTDEVLALQAKWKTIGYASSKQNQKVFERFRAACDVFFTRKGEFFKNAKNELNSNLEKKISLCEQAESLKDSTDWKATTEKLTALQKEWKAVGPVVKKQSEAVWKRFSAACDAFFENRNKNLGSQRSEEQKNLAAKKDILQTLQELSDKVEQGVDDVTDELGDKLHEIINSWNAIGHVPFRDKDKVYKSYRTMVDNLFDKLHSSESSRRISNFRKTVRESGNNLDREREKLVQAYERVKNEIKTYENNLGFLKTGSKSGNSLVAEMQRKMEKLKADAQELLAKIKTLDSPEEESK